MQLKMVYQKTKHPFVVRTGLILSLCISACFTAFGQNNYAELDKVVLPSPNVATIDRFGNFPMGYFTGTPNVKVPLFEIQSGSLKIPVNLSYHAGGVKMNDIGSNVGMGWALMAGGVIHRIMKGGEVDERPDFGYWDKYPINVTNK